MLTPGWNGTGPYVQPLYMPGLLPSDTPFVIADYDTQGDVALAPREAWACVDKVDALNTILQITCLSEVPKAAVPLRVILHR